MANEKNDISEIVKTCKILLLDIEGTTTSISFVKDKLFPYAEENVKDFLDNEWETDNVKEAVSALRKLALEDEENKVDGVVTIPAEDASKDEQIEGLVKNFKWQMSLDRKVGPLKQLQGLIWKKGYDKGDIKGHVYDDVSPALELWRSVEGRKVYIYSSGSVQAQKLLFAMSSAGDMLKLIDGHFDTAVGAKQEASSYTTIAEKIGCKAEEIVFLTDIDKEAEAARSAGVQAALVSREGNAPLSEEITSSYPVIYSFTELAATKKRKPDEQDEQNPAKVPKTDVETDVKTPVETTVKDSPQPTPTIPPKDEDTEKMEVEEEAPSKEEIPAEKSTEDAVEKIETVVEEITGTNEVTDIPVCDAKPVIIDSTETEHKETEVMESEAAEVIDSVPECKENGDKDAAEPEATPIVITEIKDVTDDKESLSQVTEIIEDLVPIVEEPAVQDMEDLQNVGEVLQKECDEILLKVEDVTNLDSMALKPLQPIAEETMETENVDTNDIVEGILDTEQEIEMKKCKDIDLDTVQEKPVAKPESAKSEEQAVPDKPSDIPSEVKQTQTKLDAGNSTEENVDESSLEKEKVKELNSTEEIVEKTSMTEEKVKENSTEEQITASNKTEAKESDLSNENVKDNCVTEEKADESSITSEKVKDNTIIEEKAKESSITSEKVKDNTIIEEKAKESNIAEDTVKESNITNEKIVESSPVAEKVEDSSSVEIKAEENKGAEELQTKSEEEMKIIKTEESSTDTNIRTPEINDSKPGVDENKSEEKLKTEEMQTEDIKSDNENKKIPTEQVSAEKPAEKLSEENSMEVDQIETPVETKESEKVGAASPAETVATESDTKETQVNGNAANGDTEMTDVNGDGRKEDELCSRLSMENGKEVLNGAKGDATEKEVKNENNGDDVSEVADIKVKTVAMDEPRNDPIEQPTEA